MESLWASQLGKQTEASVECFWGYLKLSDLVAIINEYYAIAI